MIINGKAAFVGSDGDKAKNNIDHYLSVSPRNKIMLNLDQTTSELKIDYNVNHQEDNSVVNFALVERGLESQVTAGENNGRTLVHDNVVRDFKTMDLKNDKGTITFSKPQAKDLTRFSVIAFVQFKGDMTISAANSVDLSN